MSCKWVTVNNLIYSQFQNGPFVFLKEYNRCQYTVIGLITSFGGSYE